MSRHTLLWEVTRWEFSRWFKWKDQILSLLIVVISGLAFFGVGKLLKKQDKPPVIAVFNPTEVLLLEWPGLQLEVLDTAADPSQIDHLNQGAWDGYLVLDQRGDARLTVRTSPAFQNELETLLNQSFQTHRIAQSGIPAETLAAMVAPVPLEVSFTSDGKQASKADLIATGLVNGLILLALFLCLSYQFAAITGEKQNRVTEQIISAVSPQTWMDGKILGVSLLALVSMATYSLGFGLFILMGHLFGSPMPLSLAIDSPFTMFAILGFALGGFFMWNACFAGIAALINDPNSSSKSALMFLPMLTLGFGFFALKRPDTLAMQILSLVPFTAPSVMPVRLLLGTPALWEILLSLVALLAMAWVFRRLAGIVFSVGMLMYGKEPSFKEVWRWVRSPRVL